MSTCDHAGALPVFSASSVPVRLICTCGEEWRVVPVDALVTLPVYARSLSGPMGGLVVKPRCNAPGCGRELGECVCSDERMEAGR